MSQHLLDYIVSQIHDIAGTEAIIESKLNFDRPMVVLASQFWHEPVAKMLKEDEKLQFDFLSCLLGVDYQDRMEVVYQLYSISLDQYAVIKVITDSQQPEVSSVSAVWGTANWHERETYDLLGIRFPGHPNLTRILLDDEWQGHPLRKDYSMPDDEVDYQMNNSSNQRHSQETRNQDGQEGSKDV